MLKNKINKKTINLADYYFPNSKVIYIKIKDSIH